MFPKALTAGETGARKVVTIRAAVPLKYERKPKQESTLLENKDHNSASPSDLQGSKTAEKLADELQEDTSGNASEAKEIEEPPAQLQKSDTSTEVISGEEVLVTGHLNKTENSLKVNQDNHQGHSAPTYAQEPPIGANNTELCPSVGFESSPSQATASNKSIETGESQIATVPELSDYEQLPAEIAQISTQFEDSLDSSKTEAEADLSRSDSRGTPSTRSSIEIITSSRPEMTHKPPQDYTGEKLPTVTPVCPPNAPFSPTQTAYIGPLCGPPQQPMDGYQPAPPYYLMQPPYPAQPTPFFNQPLAMNMLGGRPPPTPSSASMDDGSAGFDQKVAGHVFSNFNVDEYADMRLKVTHEGDKFEEVIFSLHKLVVSRSETLRDLLSQYAGNYDEDNRTVVNMRLSDRYVTPVALEFALRTCYGQPVSSFTRSKYLEDSEGAKQESITNMTESLAFTAAGHLLKLEDVVLRGLEVADSVLDWDNLKFAISFGLEASNYRNESPEHALLRPFFDSQRVLDLPPPLARMSGRETTQDQSRPSTSGIPPLYPDRSPTSQLRHASDLLKRCLQYISNFCPDSWTLDNTARPLLIVDRLPVTVESRRIPSRSRLANIQFGEQAPEFEPRINEINQLISTIVLSLPFDSLILLFRTSPSSINRQLRQIVDERERRRLTVLYSESVDWNQRRLAKDAEWFWVGHQECVVYTAGGEEVFWCNTATVYRSQADQEMAEKRDQASRGFVRSS